MKYDDTTLIQGAETFATTLADAIQKRAEKDWSLWSIRGVPLWYVLKQRLSANITSQVNAGWTPGNTPGGSY